MKPTKKAPARRTKTKPEPLPPLPLEAARKAAMLQLMRWIAEERFKGTTFQLPEGHLVEPHRTDSAEMQFIRCFAMGTPEQAARAHGIPQDALVHVLVQLACGAEPAGREA